MPQRSTGSPAPACKAALPGPLGGKPRCSSSVTAACGACPYQRPRAADGVPSRPAQWPGIATSRRLAGLWLSVRRRPPGSAAASSHRYSVGYSPRSGIARPRLACPQQAGRLEAACIRPCLLGEVVHYRRRGPHQVLSRRSPGDEPHLPVHFLGRLDTFNRPQRGGDAAAKLTLQRLLPSDALMHVAAMSFGGLISQLVASRPIGGVGRAKDRRVRVVVPRRGCRGPR